MAIDESPKDAPDIVDFKLRNPLVYIKYWWKRIMANEGIDFRLKVRPITALAIAVIAFSTAFGLGGVVLPIAFPWLKIDSNKIIVPTSTPTPQGIIWKETALKGTLKSTTTNPIKFYLLTSSDEAVTLQIPENINLVTLVGKRIFASGQYDSKNKILKVTDVQDLEVLSTTPVPIPTDTPSPIPEESSSPNPQ